MNPRVLPEARDRLATFNDARASIVDQVVGRVVDAHIELAAQGQDDSLEYVLNEVAFSEIRRLEKSSGRENKKRLGRWHELAHKLGHMSEADKREELTSIVRYHAQDIAGNFNPKVYRFANDILPPALSFLLNPISGLREGVQALGAMAESIRIDGPLDTINKCCEKGTLVLTPTHSSNLDSIVLGFAMNRSGLPPVTYGAGKNLFSNAFMSFFMENLGAYRVDRRMRFSLYKEVLKEYSTILLERGFLSLFFPGGTRSRSNLVEKRLKLGLLGTTATAMVNSLQKDSASRRIFIVPVTINYRLVLEAETLITDYLADTGKSRYIIEDDEFSRLGRIVDFARKTLAHEGAAIVKFGTPLDPFGNEVDENGDSRDGQGQIVDPASYLQNREGQVCADTQRDSVYTRMLGRKLASVYRRDTVFLETHLVARAAMELAHRRSGISDVLRLMRLSETALALPSQELAEVVDALRKVIVANPDAGSLEESLLSKPADEIIQEAIRFMSKYHTKRALYQVGEHVRIGSMKLLYYYRNRSGHLNFKWEG